MTGESEPQTRTIHEQSKRVKSETPWLPIPGGGKGISSDDPQRSGGNNIVQLCADLRSTNTCSGYTNIPLSPLQTRNLLNKNSQYHVAMLLS
ncbi:hypothetical protein EYR41_000444 [Orbilia oligospora]|uniref:Uncharacterized protein n=1 Tax=Orbilia oligospora TaxID=2813651 RepID=A0A7C8KK21_ORBOL|nr:hypothetical protein TWF751_009009 [Orbilia oligospora]TGJ73338.1 hypothetical protein EYR41_000444 [Orbilia oligospora]